MARQTKACEVTRPIPLLACPARNRIRTILTRSVAFRNGALIAVTVRVSCYCLCKIVIRRATPRQGLIDLEGKASLEVVP